MMQFFDYFKNQDEITKKFLSVLPPELSQIYIKETKSKYKCQEEGTTIISKGLDKYLDFQPSQV